MDTSKANNPARPSHSHLQIPRTLLTALHGRKRRKRKRHHISYCNEKNERIRGRIQSPIKEQVSNRVCWLALTIVVRCGCVASFPISLLCSSLPYPQLYPFLYASCTPPPQLRDPLPAWPVWPLNGDNNLPPPRSHTPPAPNPATQTRAAGAPPC